MDTPPILVFRKNTYLYNTIRMSVANYILMYTASMVSAGSLLIINHMLISKELKELYEAPSTTVFEVKTESVVCVSGGDYPQWGGELI